MQRTSLYAKPPCHLALRSIHCKNGICMMLLTYLEDYVILIMGVLSTYTLKQGVSFYLFLFSSHCSYSHYDQKPVSIIDTLTMTLKFVCLQEQGEEEREDKGEERAGKRARTSLHPVPRFVSSRELEVMESSLTRWIGELKQDVEGEMQM